MLLEFKDEKSPKISNLKSLYLLIRKNGPISQSEIIQKTGLKQSTCSRLLEELRKAELIYENGYGESIGGRKPLMYQVNSNSYFIVGMEMTQNGTTILLMNMDLAVIGESTIEEDTDEINKKITEKVDELLQDHLIPNHKLLGIGLGMENQTADHESIDELRRYLESYYQVRVLVDSTTNTALWGEYSRAYPDVEKNIIFIHIGNYIKWSVLANGRIIRGGFEKKNQHGDGHMVIDINGRKCVCGNYGCIHAYSTMEAIRKEVISFLKRGMPSLLASQYEDYNEVNFNAIVTAVKDGDELCVNVLQDSAYYAGIALSNFINILQPEMIVLGGPIVNKVELFYDKLISTLYSKNSITPNSSMKISRLKLGSKAPAIGAGYLVIQHFLGE